MAKAPRSLAGRVVAITGGARGIGRATAAALIAKGAGSRSATSTSSWPDDRRASSARGRSALPLDVTDRDSLRRVSSTRPSAGSARSTC